MFHFQKLASHFDKFSLQKKNDARTLVIIIVDKSNVIVELIFMEYIFL